MKKLIMLAALACLNACTVPAMTLGVPATPAPLAATTIDDKWLSIAWKTHDAHQDAMNLFMDAKPSVIGTPAMKRWADANDAVTDALVAGEAAVAAGSTTDYFKAVIKAKEALAALRSAVSALRGN